MRNARWFVVCLAVMVCASAAVAELKVPSHTGWVVDRARMFSARERQQIAATLQGLKSAKSGAQMAVLTIPSLKGDSLEMFSMRVVEDWKLGGKKSDNGLLLLIVRDDRKIRIETGYGLEGRLNDARCGDIIRGMGPFFRSRRFADGALYAIGVVQQYLTGQRPSGVPQRPSGSRSRRGGSSARMLIFIFLFFVFFPFLRWRYGWGHTIYLGGGGFGSGGFGGGGGFSGGGFSGGGFSGGGGSFGGGGASGGW